MRSSSSRPRPACVWGVIALARASSFAFVPVAGGLAAMQPEPTAEPPAASSPPSGTAAKPAPAVPSLDELLGTTTPEATPQDPAGAALPSDTANPSDPALERRLSAEEMGDAFKQAVTLMGDAATRIKSKDVGLNTQRVQEDALRKLDELISQLEQQQQQQQSSSSSSQQQQQQDKTSARQQQTGSRKSKPGDAKERSGRASDSSEMDPPALQEGALRPALESAPAAWGSLPERVREMLMQGATDRFSKTWEAATESYYRRLAEENNRP